MSEPLPPSALVEALEKLREIVATDSLTQIGIEDDHRWPANLSALDVVAGAAAFIRSTMEASQAAKDVLAERGRQVADEGYNASHDDMATRCQLALAAMGYVQAASCAQRDIADSLPAPKYWPWDERYWKPRDPRRNLVRAGALIIAEIERLDRIRALTGATDER